MNEASLKLPPVRFGVAQVGVGEGAEPPIGVHVGRPDQAGADQVGQGQAGAIEDGVVHGRVHGRGGPRGRCR